MPEEEAIYLTPAGSGDYSSGDPPTPPPLPPGYLQIAGGYYMIESGSCGGALISTKSECEAAAAALDLPAKTAVDKTSITGLDIAPGCQLQSYGYSLSLYVYGGGSSGACDLSKQCICKSTPP